MTPATERSVVSIGEISDMLAQRMEALCLELLPHGHREGNEWVEAKRAKGGLGDSLRVNIRGSRRGVWGHFGGGSKGGDALALVGYILFQDDTKQAIRWSRRWLGIDDADPRALEDRRRRLAIAKRAQDEAAAKEEEQNRESARRIFLNSQERLAGTPVDTYLRGRGIDLTLLGRQPRSLRFHPQLWNGETKRKWPAMVACINAPDGKMIAVHRTWLEIQGDGSVKKAPLENAKMTLGLYKGGCIPLWRGASNKPLKDAPAGDKVIISEGIEDGLTYALAAADMRVLVAVSLSNMGSLQLPPAIGTVILGLQNDENPKARAAADRAISHFLSEGRLVLDARPPANRKDANELLQKGLEDPAAEEPEEID